MNNISVNVFNLETNQADPVCLTQFKYHTTVNLLMLPRENNYLVDDNYYDIKVQCHE